jgi:hypothetical protein
LKPLFFFFILDIFCLGLASQLSWHLFFCVGMFYTTYESARESLTALKAPEWQLSEVYVNVRNGSVIANAAFAAYICCCVYGVGINIQRGRSTDRGTTRTQKKKLKKKRKN